MAESWVVLTVVMMAAPMVDLKELSLAACLAG